MNRAPNAAVLGWIDGAAKAARRARRDPRDAEALHRFRVGARRLFVYAKAFEKPLGVPKKLRKRLRRALRVTGACRDRHVHEAWLNDYARTSRKGAAVLVKTLLRDCEPEPGRRWWRDVGGTLKKMRRAVERRSPDGRSVRRAAEKEWRRLLRRLRRLDRAEDPSAMHAARLAVKKLRCLTATLDRAPRGLPADADLSGLQAAFGEAHDRDVIAAGIGALERTAALRSPVRQALRQLKREKRVRLACARSCWKPMLEMSRGRNE